jgi:putative oxygen-independent coproporphyrinogen III oxidase
VPAAVLDGPPPIETLADDLAGVPLGIYVHVPFCARRCGYCAFTTYALGDDGDLPLQERFVDGALAEVALAARLLGGSRPPITSVFLGGGTPTMLSDDQLGRLLAGITGHFDHAPDLEVTVEANPDGLRPGQLASLREAGATRISFGLQSTSRRVLAVLDRTHDPERALSAVADALDAGFAHVSLDLIHGTPHETEADWSATVAAAIASGVDHISAYALAVEPGTRLAARVRGGAVPQPDPDVAAQRYRTAERLLSATGFEWYELSNWARSVAARCRHNDLYWSSHNWWGVGPGAHSHLAGVRWWNADHLGAWHDTVSAGVPPGVAHEVLGGAERLLEHIMLGMRRSSGLSLTDLGRTDEIPLLVEDGLVELRGDRLVLTLDGRLLADHVVRRLA